MSPPFNLLHALLRIPTTLGMSPLVYVADLPRALHQPLAALPASHIIRLERSRQGRILIIFGLNPFLCRRQRGIDFIHSSSQRQRILDAKPGPGPMVWRRGMRSVAGHADAAAGEGRRGMIVRVEDGPFIGGVLEEADDGADRGVPVLEHVHDFLSGHGSRHPLMGPVSFVREGDHVDERVLRDGEVEHVRVGAHVHALIVRFFGPQGGHGLVHLHETPERDFAAERGVGCRVVFAQEELPHAGANAIAADH